MLLQDYPTLGNVNVKEGIQAERVWAKNYSLAGWFDNIKTALKKGTQKIVQAKVKPAIQAAATKEVQKAVSKIVNKGGKFFKQTTTSTGAIVETPASAAEVVKAKAGVGLKFGIPALIGAGLLGYLLLRRK